MANPFQAMSGANMPGPFGNFTRMIQQFNQFKNNFQGDPKQKVQELLNSGAMSQSQFNQLQQAAKQFQSMMGK